VSANEGTRQGRRVTCVRLNRLATSLAVADDDIFILVVIWSTNDDVAVFSVLLPSTYTLPSDIPITIPSAITDSTENDTNNYQYQPTNQ
jgi:hypothetical protein